MKLATVIGIITESNHIVEQAAEKEGGFINMCGALERLEKRGIQQGLEQGIEQGLERGIEQGLEKGIQQGIAQGIAQEKKEIVLQMLRKGMDKGLIREITGVDEETIEKLHKEVQI